PALNIHRYGIMTDMRVSPFNVNSERCGGSAEPLRSDASLVDLVQQPVLEFRDLGIGVAGADFAEATGFFCELHRNIGRAAEPHSEDDWGARLRSGVDDAFQDKALDPVQAFRWVQHTQKAHVFRPRSLWCGAELERAG